MPSAPEFCCALGTERLTEILRKSDSEQLSAPDNDVHTSGEFHIELYCICNSPCCYNDTAVRCIITKNHTYGNRQPVSDHLFLKQSPEYSDIPAGQIVHIKRSSLIQGIACIRISADWSFHDLWKKCKEQSRLFQFSLCPDLSPVYIRHITNRLQCVKRDSDRHQDLFLFQSKRQYITQNACYVAHKEIVVFQICKYTEECQHAKCKHPPGFLLIYPFYFLFFASVGRRQFCLLF